MGMADKKSKTSPRDFFLNLLSIIALYVTATSFGALVFQYINIFIPDALDATRYGINSYSAMRFPIAALFVLFPVYVWSAKFLRKEYESHPERGNISIRKWLVYFTLFVAAVVIIGDLVSLVFRFLDGEITTRFILKVLSVLVIAGSVFYYYFSSLRDFKGKWLKPFTNTAIAIVSVAVLGSFFVIGSPVDQRERRFDDKRVSDLQYLQSEIIVFWQNKDVLPSTLSELESDIRGVRLPSDPETGEQYSYKVLGTETFELCATFSTDSDADASQIRSPYPYYQADWGHEIGEVCFERVIDKDFYNDDNFILPKPVRL